MPKRQNNRVSTTPSNSGLNPAFARLNIDGLPADDLTDLTVEKPLDNPESPRRQSSGRVCLRRETAHRGGKKVIVVDQFEAHISDERIGALARQLRRTCNCGGTLRGRTIEVQGAQAGKVRQLLEAEGFRVAGVR